ncbi:hypothetical protein QTQ03_22735 [Micromonospora sp. WMMA1363]|uniref:hypothetical protein n=1 Tax=Micromonospora sp. WMMA1363 TaxID=3053985 RepID=UPI00259CA5B8|nr:hypothetical protein [Micromonospora sp. WMMA1363]MDM4722266.1 hypothetical protein [Micromonospora sp. WMMA1363]
MEGLFAYGTLLGLAGAIIVTWAGTNAIGAWIGVDRDEFRKWIAGLLALVLSYMTAVVVDGAGIEKAVVAFVNALIIFVASLGINQLPPGNRRATEPSTADLAKGRVPRYLRSWI